MWNRAKLVLMTIILVAVSLTVYFSLYLKACMPAGKQWNAASFQYSRLGHMRSGVGPLIPYWYKVPASSPLRFEMSSPSVLFWYQLGINLNSSTKVLFQLQATAPVYFRIVLGGRIIISRIPTISLDSEFYVEDSGFYVFEFEPVQSNPDATVIFDARLDC